jgi:hypothetical protein
MKKNNKKKILLLLFFIFNYMTCGENRDIIFYITAPLKSIQLIKDLIVKSKDDIPSMSFINNIFNNALSTQQKQPSDINIKIYCEVIEPSTEFEKFRNTIFQSSFTENIKSIDDKSCSWLLLTIFDIASLLTLSFGSIFTSKKACNLLIQKHPNKKLYFFLLNIFSILIIATIAIPFYFYFFPETKIRKEYLYLFPVLSGIGSGGLLTLVENIGISYPVFDVERNQLEQDLRNLKEQE